MTANQCLCGKVTISLQNHEKEVGACHCVTCRKWSGGPYISVKHSGELSIDGSECLSIYQSSAWAERGFCKNCGTHLFYRLRDKAENYLPVGLLEDQTGLVLDHQIFIDQKPEYYSFAERTQNLTRAEVMAMFAQSEDG